MIWNSLLWFHTPSQQQHIDKAYSLIKITFWWINHYKCLEINWQQWSTTSAILILSSTTQNSLQKLTGWVKSVFSRYDSRYFWIDMNVLARLCRGAVFWKCSEESERPHSEGDVYVGPGGLRAVKVSIWFRERPQHNFRRSKDPLSLRVACLSIKIFADFAGNCYKASSPVGAFSE